MSASNGISKASKANPYQRAALGALREQRMADRRAEVLRLKRRGWTLARIARTVGASVVTVKRDLYRAGAEGVPVARLERLAVVCPDCGWTGPKGRATPLDRHAAVAVRALLLAGVDPDMDLVISAAGLHLHSQPEWLRGRVAVLIENAKEARR